MTTPSKQELNVQVEVKDLGGGQVELDIRVPPEPVQKMRNQVLNAFARRANVPGFRQGKAPRSLVERMVDQDALREQIVDSLLDDAYEAAVEQAEIKPLGDSQIGEATLTDEGELRFSATLTQKPHIELGEYKGLKITQRITPVTDAQVNAELDRARARRAEFRDIAEDATIENGDLVIVDYEAFVDGEKRDDISTQGYPLEVGGDQLFPQMNDVLLGSKVGEMREFEITYAEDHSDESLRGKTAQFKVTVTQGRRRQLPELTDEFAKDVSGMETVEELRKRMRENLEAIGTAMSENDVREELVRIVSNSAQLDVPESIVGREVDRRIEEIEDELDRRGLTLPQYLDSQEISFEDWRADIESDARSAARRALVLDAIGERENIEVSNEDLDEEIRRIAATQNLSDEDVSEQLRDSSALNGIVTRIYQRKAIQFLFDNSEITEEEVEPEEETGAETTPVDSDSEQN